MLFYMLFLSFSLYAPQYKKTTPLALIAGSTLAAYSIQRSTSKSSSVQESKNSSKNRSMPPKHIVRVTQR